MSTQKEGVWSDFALLPLDFDVAPSSAALKFIEVQLSQTS